jgi:hypothetical protein
MAAQIFQGIREGDWLSQARVTGYLRLLAVANVVGLALAVCRAHGWVLPPERHFGTEFLSFYAAGRLAAAGHAAAVYAPGLNAAGFVNSFQVPPAHLGMERALAHDPGVMYFGFFYPPVFWLLCAPLALLPFYGAYAAWVGATGVLLAACLRRICGGWRKLAPALAYLPVIQTAGVGENAFLSAALVGFGLLALERRKLLAGACFGALCYKPHFLLPIGVLLLIGRQWRVLGAAAVCAAALGLLSAVLFGWRSWVTYFAVIVPHADYVFSHGGVSYGQQVTPGSALRLLGGGERAALIAEAAGLLFGAACLFGVRGASLNVRAAMLTAGFPLMLPLMLDYDLTTTGLAIAFLLREARGVYLPYEKTALALLFAAPLVAWVFRNNLGVPIDWLIPAGFMLVLCGRRERAEAVARFRPA